MKKYDAIVIGGGPGGTAAAYSLKEQGKTVAVIEADLWGGTCPNRGCDPKKILMSAVEAKARVEKLNGKGFEASPEIHWEELMAFKRTYTDSIPSGTKSGIEEAEIDAYDGQAEFVDAHTIEVADERLEAKQFLIATGQRPSLLPVDGQEYLQTSTDFLNLAKLPERITFIGAGYIAFELATIANAAGAEVHVIQHNDQPLKGFDKELAMDLTKHLEEKGITFHFNVDVDKVEAIDPGYRLTAENFELETDMVVVAAGRVPNIEALKLDNAQLEYTKKGITVDDHLRTSQEHIFACGDVLDKSHPKLTPVSGFEASYVVKAMNGETEPIHYPLIPSVVFGDQRLARIGLSEKELSENSEKYHSETMDLGSWFTYFRVNDKGAKIKFVYDEEDRIVAITCLNEMADELINYFNLILEKQMTHEEIADYVFAYPTPASDLEYFIK
ncbi:NAD(P)/FAD-dependent oxidoreductase [Enterococcus sp. 669A]|uniref:NAD(P)/FAD-dependent oxidoreductase n=1 Tax=Candidatus Enterococcus moelleringii TaxID=2815325 RepID=A0ABS3LBQ1_9ENTE|nr:NAD(P)/FAD-dependent oxidoreductase [Enterococcus sp. 669A]MBO1307055.1 NAD(P)/FAD-dependent oxidoreductase [Enterococcus sp. 669A]